MRDKLTNCSPATDENDFDGLCGLNLPKSKIAIHAELKGIYDSAP